MENLQPDTGKTRKYIEERKRKRERDNRAYQRRKVMKRLRWMALCMPWKLAK